MFLNYNFSGKRALVRVDFNVPLKDGKITDNSRITAALPTIKKILKDGGSVILMSHLGRPKGEEKPEYSLKQIVPELSNLLEAEVLFAGNCIGEKAFDLSASLEPGKVILLENLRYFKEETNGDRAFAEKLAKHGDVYVNDAFGTAHRAHASTAVVAQYFEPENKMFGSLLEAEISNLEKVLNKPEKPVLAVIGGAKVSSKIEVINNLLDTANEIIVGGGMAFTFIKSQGGNIGTSLVEDEMLDIAVDILQKAKSKGVKIWLPTDVIAADKFDADANTQLVNSDEIPNGWMGLDIGEQTIKSYKEVINRAKTILWNGPMGVFEMTAFEKGTKEIAKCIANVSVSQSYSLVGGGDSVAAVNKFNLGDKVSYVSTGGGAMLEYLEGKRLPGIAAIKS